MTELESICREELKKLPKYRCVKLVASYPRTLEAVITAKGASTKYCVEGLNTYVQLKSEVYIRLSQIHLILVKIPRLRSVRITTILRM
jgi:hypothetical protein